MLAIAVVVAFVRPASAGELDAADQLFRAASAAHARGDYSAAAAAFEEAHRRAPHPATLYNAARSWEAAGDAPRAADDYARALEGEGLAEAQRKLATERLARIEPRLGRIDVRGSPGARVTVAHVAETLVPVIVHVAPGHHVVRFVRDGADAVTRTVEVSADARVVVEDAVPGAVTASAPAPPRALSAGTPPGSARSRVPVVIAFGAAGVLGATTVVLGVATLDARSAYERTGRTDADARDDAVAMRAFTNVALAGAVLAAAAGIVLLVWSGSGRPAVATGASGGSPRPPVAFVF